MSDAQPKVKKTRQPKASELDEFKQWLASLEMNNPTLHENGPNYATAILTVDFGEPLEEVNLTPERTAELVSRLRNATKLVCKKDVNVRVQNDTINGIWWTSIG